MSHSVRNHRREPGRAGTQVCIVRLVLAIYCMALIFGSTEACFLPLTAVADAQLKQFLATQAAINQGMGGGGLFGQGPLGMGGGLFGQQQGLGGLPLNNFGRPGLGGQPFGQQGLNQLQPGGFNPQQGSFPQQQGGFPQQQGGFPQQQGGFPPQQGGFG